MFSIRCKRFEHTYNIGILTYTIEKIIISNMTSFFPVLTYIEDATMCNYAGAAVNMWLTYSKIGFGIFYA